jgi:peptide/nickel transport system ATP-binding protein
MRDQVDRVMVMYGGTVVENASTLDLFQTRAHPYTQGLFAARPQLGLKRGTRLQTIPGNVPEIFNWPQGCAFADRCPHAEARCRMAVPLPEQIHAHPNSDSSSMQTHDHWVSCLKWQQLEASV